MPQTDPLVSAAIDVGSNSVHLLVARVGAARADEPLSLVPLDDRSELIGLGDAVDRDGAIPAAEMSATLDVIASFIDAARSLGAQRVVVLGTDPLRRAGNARDLAAGVERRRAVSLSVLTEHQEAALTFMGVTRGTPPRNSFGAVDIGGGSTEVSLYTPGLPLTVVPLRLGSARLTKELVRNDPPSREEVDALRAAAADAVGRAPWPAAAQVAVERITFVGGTATNIERMSGLTREHLEQDLVALMELPADEVVERYGVRSRRAQQLVAGVVIVLAVLDRIGLGEADVTDASLRDGAIVATALHGDDWLESIDELTTVGRATHAAGGARLAPHSGGETVP